jgi:VanZ family protein
MTRDRLWWGLWTVYAAAWTAALLSTVPLAAKGTLIPQEYFFSTGKALHVSAYTVFALLTSRLPLTAVNRRWMLLVVVLHGPLTEFLQQFTGRTASVMDVGFDWIGVGLGVGLSWSRWKKPLAA